MKLKQFILLFILFALISCGTSFGEKKYFGNLEVFYSENTPIVYVNAIGNYFVDNNLVLPTKHSIKLTSNHNTFILKLILDSKFKTLPDSMQHHLNLLETDIKQNVFKNVNFELEICDANFYPLNLKN